MSDALNAPRAGFSLVELLVVVAVLAVLISLLVPSFHRLRYSASNDNCISRKSQLLTALNLYAADHGGYYPMRWPDEKGKVYWHPYWWGRTNSQKFDIHEEIEEYCGTKGQTPDMLMCGVTAENMWGVPAADQWPLGRLYRTSVAVYAGWNWDKASPRACKPQQPLDAIPQRSSEARANRPLVGDVIEYTTGAHPVFNGWMTNHAYDPIYHRRSSAGLDEQPPEPIPFGYADGSVLGTRQLQPLYYDPGWAMRYWAHPDAKGSN